MTDDRADAGRLDAVLSPYTPDAGDDMPTAISKRATVAAALYYMGELKMAARMLEDMADAIRVEIAQARVNATATGRTHARALITRVCGRCGGRFPVASLRSPATYCSSVCRQAAYRARAKVDGA